MPPLAWLPPLACHRKRPTPPCCGGQALRIPLGFPGPGNVNWKSRPDFGEHSRGGLSKFTSYAVDGLLLAVVGALVLSANGLGPITAWVAAGMAIVGVLSLHAQIGFTDPFLGGRATSPALLLGMAVVALTRARTDPASPSTNRSTR